MSLTNFKRNCVELISCILYMRDFGIMKFVNKVRVVSVEGGVVGNEPVSRQVAVTGQ